jgi:hypothetical protein
VVDQATADAAIAMIDTVIAEIVSGGSGTDTFTLTNETDVATANVFNAPQVYTPGGDDRINSLQDEDQLTGRGENATLNATLGNANDNGAVVITPHLENIQTINAAFTGSNIAGGNGAVVTLDLQDATGVVNANITRISAGANQAELANIMSVVPTMSLANTNANQSGVAEFSFSAGVLQGENAGRMDISNVQVGALNIGQNNTNAGANGVGPAGFGVINESYETLALNSAGAANTIGRLGLPMDTGTEGSVTITGDQALTLAAATSAVSAVGSTNVEVQVFGGGIAQAQGRLATIDASGLEAALALAIGAHNGGSNLLSTGKAGTSGQTQDVTVTGTAHDDTFYLSDFVQAGDVINGGEGEDRVVVYANGNAGLIEGVETVDVQINGYAGDVINLDFDMIPDAVIQNVRNITHSNVTIGLLPRRLRRRQQQPARQPLQSDG